MFSDNLSFSLLQLCETHRLSHERAAELCGCSSRYFGNIIRRKSCPFLLIFEGICRGFELTPNQLLAVSAPSPVTESFRSPMPVTEFIHFDWGKEGTSFPVCPRCGLSFEREYQAYCDRCGQCLCWRNFSQAVPKR